MIFRPPFQWSKLDMQAMHCFCYFFNKKMDNISSAHLPRKEKKGNESSRTQAWSYMPMLVGFFFSLARCLDFFFK